MKTDVELRRDVLDEIEWEPSIDAAQIGVTAQKHAAFDAVQHLDGVKGVCKMINVKPPRASATEVKSRTEAAFRRNAELDAGKVKVETHGGKVTLHGQLQSWAERDEADRTAWAAPGVTEVENLIAVVG